MKILVIVESGTDNRKKGLPNELRGKDLLSVWESNTKHYRREIAEYQEIEGCLAGKGEISGKKGGKRKSYHEDVLIISVSENQSSPSLSEKIRSLLKTLKPEVPKNDVVVIGKKSALKDLPTEKRNCSGRYWKAGKSMPFGWMIIIDWGEEKEYLSPSEISSVLDEATNTFAIRYPEEIEDGRLSFAFA
mgnify:CR=1 FL=1